MYRFLLRTSRKLFGWPPEPGTIAAKHALVAQFAQGAPTLVETGTFEGDMVEAQRHRFSRLLSIEMADALFEAAQKRFAEYPQITILHGDSGKVLPESFKLFTGPATFWLDGHYSGGVTAGGNEDPPILNELAMIAARQEPGDVVLIDDARLFGWRRGYPRISTVQKFAAEQFPGHEFRVESDVICIVPR